MSCNSVSTADLLGMLSAMVGEEDADNAQLSVYLNIAKAKVMNRLYPMGYSDEATVPARYRMLWLEVACFLFNKRGAEGEKQHNENGVQRTYGGADVPEALLSQITPMGGVF